MKGATFGFLCSSSRRENARGCRWPHWVPGPWPGGEVAEKRV